MITSNKSEATAAILSVSLILLKFKERCFLNYIIIVQFILVFSCSAVWCINDCPLAAYYSPCSCSAYNTDNYTDALLLDCYNKNLDDTKASSILTAFLQPGVSPLAAVRFWANQLTRVPDQIKQFPLLSYADFLNNLIGSIPSSSFNFDAVKLNNLNLGFNRLTNIDAGAFQGIIKSKYLIKLPNFSF